MNRIAIPTCCSLLLASVCLLLTGCTGGVQADYDKLGLVEISGIVTLDGQPLSGAVVMFEAPDTTFCYGTTDASGRYTLKLNSEKTGVVPGEKVVRISTTARTGEEAISSDGEEDPDAKPADGAEKVPACYHADSKIMVQVTESDASFNFDLLSDCSVTGRS